MNCTPRILLLVFVSVGLYACASHPPAAATVAAPAPSTPAADPAGPRHVVEALVNPTMQFRIDAFSVPAASRAEFETAMHENAALLATLPGFRGHTVFEKTSGPTTFNIVTIAAWDSAEAMKAAGDKVREHYQKIGFDMQATIARWGVAASIGGYRTPAELQ